MLASFYAYACVKQLYSLKFYRTWT